MKRLLISAILAMSLIFPTNVYAKEFDILDWILSLLKTVEIKTKQEPDIISSALPYDGYNQLSHRNELKVMMNIDPVIVPWCAGFMNYVLDKAGYQHTDSLLASSYHQYGTKVKIPQRGDIVILRRTGGSGRHVGFFYDFVYNDGEQYIRLLGGNQQKAVRISEYPMNIVIEYRRPVKK